MTGGEQKKGPFDTRGGEWRGRGGPGALSVVLKGPRRPLSAVLSPPPAVAGCSHGGGGDGGGDTTKLGLSLRQSARGCKCGLLNI